MKDQVDKKVSEKFNRSKNNCFLIMKKIKKIPMIVWVEWWIARKLRFNN